MKINPHQGAFPADSRDSSSFGGVSIRMYFAAKMMAGLAACPNTVYDHAPDAAKAAVIWADALIKELSK